ncbi:hypothetical protein BDK51DRAFT_47136 [Blyttiomyces helicus]|uniref:Uncharacterized protein n=1 Tax=Blyttiomyces helicus TaxID=388810 RepID=A0A4P9W4M2_9FUNG|nr:hypothetical protein BDK51DRAFT_47136 [Blyttiomyces helicus]|eukprot:RKO86233.1 hypothetical protein BDK51DRAFT_47136 [Blyttiomyces helicus]
MEPPHLDLFLLSSPLWRSLDALSQELLLPSSVLTGSPLPTQGAGALTLPLTERSYIDTLPVLSALWPNLDAAYPLSPERTPQSTIPSGSPEPTHVPGTRTSPPPPMKLSHIDPLPICQSVGTTLKAAVPPSPELITVLPADPSPQTPPPPQPRKSKGNVTRHENATCNSCGLQQITLLLHGPDSLLSGEHCMTFTRTSCDATALMSSASLSEPPAKSLGKPVTRSVSNAEPRPAGKRKKGPVRSHSDVNYSECGRCVGVRQMCVRADGSPWKGGERRREEWVEPGFDTEVVCLPCWTKYKLCSASRIKNNGDLGPSDEFQTYERILARFKVSQSGARALEGMQAARGPQSPDRLILYPPTHAFLNAQVNRTKGVIFVSYTYMTNPGRLVYSALFRTAIAAVIAAHQTNYPCSPPLAPVCLPLHRNPPDAPLDRQHSHSSNWGGKGFVHVDHYVKSLSIDKSFF